MQSYVDYPGTPEIVKRYGLLGKILWVLIPILVRQSQRRGTSKEERRQHGADVYCLEPLEGWCVARTAPSYLLDRRISCCIVVSAPIVGTTSLKHLEDMVGKQLFSFTPCSDPRWMVIRVPGAVNVKLTPEEIKYLEEPYVPVAISGHQ